MSDVPPELFGEDLAGITLLSNQNICEFILRIIFIDMFDIWARRHILNEWSIFFLLFWSETTETKHNEKLSLFVFHLN